MHYATGTLSSVNCLVCTVADVLLRPNNDSLHIFAIDDINATRFRQQGARCSDISNAYHGIALLLGGLLVCYHCRQQSVN